VEANVAAGAARLAVVQALREYAGALAELKYAGGSEALEGEATPDEAEWRAGERVERE